MVHGAKLLRSFEAAWSVTMPTKWPRTPLKATISADLMKIYLWHKFLLSTARFSPTGFCRPQAKRLIRLMQHQSHACATDRQRCFFVISLMVWSRQNPEALLLFLRSAAVQIPMIRLVDQFSHSGSKPLIAMVHFLAGCSPFFDQRKIFCTQLPHQIVAFLPKNEPVSSLIYK